MVEPWYWDSHPRWNSVTEDAWNTTGPCVAGCQGQDTHTKDTNCCHVGKAPPAPHSVFATLILLRELDAEEPIETTYEDPTQRWLYINGANIKLLVQSTWKQTTLLSLMYVHIVTGSHDKLEFIHSFNKNALGVSCVPGTVSDNEDSVVGGEKKKSILFGAYFMGRARKM